MQVAAFDTLEKAKHWTAFHVAQTIYRILVCRSPHIYATGCGKIPGFFFANTANWPKSRFFSDQKKAMKARIQHKDGQNTRS